MSVIPYLCIIIFLIEICKKHKALKTKTVSIKEKKGLSSSPHFSPPKDPHQYEGEVLGNQNITSNKTHKKQVYIESYVCY